MQTKTRLTFDDKRRHELVGLAYNDEKYDIRHYHGLSYDNLQTLIQEGMADPSMTQNESTD